MVFKRSPAALDYTYLVIDPKSENRQFTFTISNQAFAEGRVPYQDAADLCYQKLLRNLGLETARQPLPRRLKLSDGDLDDYRAKHRPARRRG